MRKKTIVFGVGRIWKKRKMSIKKGYEVVALIDNNYRGAEEKDVFPVQYLLDSDCPQYDLILVTPKYYQEMYEQLICMGIDPTKIVTINDLDRGALLGQLKWAGRIREECMKNARLLSSRNNAIDLLPKGMVAAEVGVAYGDFSQYILDHMNPCHFYAIDYFNKDNPFISFWGRNDFSESGLPHEEWYRNRFKSYIDQERMTVCSGLSWDCLDEFEDDFFDFIYLDACHDFDSVSKDLSVIEKKIKHGGYIQFNDYTLHDINSCQYYGVVPVVNEMINRTGSQVVYYCLALEGFDDIVVKVNKN